MTAFTYVLPYLIHAVLSPTPLSPRRKVWAVCNVSLGLLIMLGGLVSSITELAAIKGGLFSGTCRLQYAYAPSNPLDPCNVSGLPADA
jgi:hypothetical protein